MARGSFNGLYTFQDVANIYGIDSSTIRKQVKNCKFCCDKEIKKFGKTWLITEQAMVEHFGNELFIAYKNKLLEEKTLEIKKLKEEAKKEKELKKQAKLKSNEDKILSLSNGDDDDDLPCDSWNIDFDEKDVLQTFTF